MFAFSNAYLSIKPFEYFDLEKLGKCHRLQHSHFDDQYKPPYNLILSVFVSAHRFRDIHISKFGDLENIGQEHDIQHLQWRHSLVDTRLPI